MSNPSKEIKDQLDMELQDILTMKNPVFNNRFYQTPRLT